MKKKTIGAVIVAIVSILISAAIALGTLLFVVNRNVEQTGNALGISWYNESDKEFTITTKEQLIEFSKLSNYYSFENQTVKLGADIVMNEGDATEWAANAPATRWSPITGFAGTFDGQGHTISGLYAKSYEAPMALFADANYLCIVTDVKLVNSYFETSGGKGTASFVSNGGGKFTKLYSDAILTHTGESVGGIGGMIDDQALFEECWFDGTINASQRRVGGIVAVASNPRVEVKHSLFSGTIKQEMFYKENAKTGGIVGQVLNGYGILMTDVLSSGSITLKTGDQTGSIAGVTEHTTDNMMSNVYAVKETFSSVIGSKGGTHAGGPIDMPKNQLTGVEAYRWTGLDFDTYWAAIEGSTPVLKYFSDSAMNLEGVVKAYDISWYNKDLSMFTISTREQLYGLWFLSCSENFENKTVSLGADIVLNEGKAADWAKKAPEHLWNPIGASVHFAGTFDGKGHTISGIYVNRTEQYAGLFGRAALNSTIKNLKLTNSYITSTTTHVGSVAGHSCGKLDAVYSDAIVEVKGSEKLVDMVGGIVGVMDYQTVNFRYKMSLTNCWFDGEIIASGKVNNIGGIAGSLAKHGQADGTKVKIDIAHCLFTGTIRDDEKSELETVINNVGGILGADRGQMLINMDDCLSAGNIGFTNKTSSNGAVIGRMFMTKSVYTLTDIYATESGCSKNAPGKAIGLVTSQQNGGVAILPDEWLTGKTAYQYSSLDFKEYWTTVADKTPELRKFATKTQSIAGLKKLADQSWYDDTKKVMVLDSVEDLYGFYVVSAFDNFKDQTVKLGADIAINTGNAADWATNVPEKEWLPIGTTNCFAGTFDGAGHTISGIYINTDAAKAGFFGHTEVGSMVKNLKVTNSYIKSSSTHIGGVIGHGRGSLDSIYSDAIIETTGSGYFVGGIVGVLEYYTKEPDLKQSATNCWFDGSINVKNNKQGIAGIIGAATRAGHSDPARSAITVAHCLNTGTITTTAKSAYVAGIVGCDWTSMVLNIDDCLNIGKVTGPSTVGAVLGRAKNATTKYKVTDSYALDSSCTLAGYGTKLPEKWLTDKKAYEYTYLNFDKYWTTVSASTPILRSFASNPQTVSGEKKLDISWYDAKKDTYVLNDLADLYGFYLLSANNNFKGKTIKLGADIAVNTGDAKTFATNAPENEWMPIGSSTAFAGIFNGQGHTISGLYMNSTTPKTGLFAQTAVGSAVKNLKVTNSYLKTTSTHAGAVIGHSYGSVDSIYCDAIIEASGAGYFVGGIVGVADYQTSDYSVKLNITNCWYDGSIKVDGAKQCIGGIVGATAKAGYADVKKATITIAHCLNTGTISAASTNTFVGGILGADWHPMVVNVDDCLNVGSVTGGSRMGSVVGDQQSASTSLRVSDSYATKSSCSAAGKAVLLPDEWLKGNAAYEYSYLDFDNYWTTVENSTPELREFAEKVLTATGEKKLDVSWYDEDATELVISDAKDLYGFYVLSAVENFAGKTIKMDKDIILNTGNAAEWATKAPANEWFPASNSVAFAGTFDGQGHAISGMYINQSAAFAGFISKTDYGSMIKNLKIVNSHVIAKAGWSGSVVGKAYGSMHSVYSDAYITSNAGFTGGIVGDVEYEHVNDFAKYSPTYTQCWYAGAMTVKSGRSGGFAGQIYGSSNAAIKDKAKVTFTDCLVTGTFTNTSASTNGSGGFVGRSERINLEFTRCIVGNVMTVASGDTAGSFFGNLPSAGPVRTMKDCYATVQSLSGMKAYGAIGTGVTFTDGKTCTFKYEEEFAGIDGYNLLKNAYNISTEKGADAVWIVTGGVPELMKYSNNVVDMGWYYNNPDATEFVIKTADELYALGYISQKTNFAGKTIKLANDIKLNDGKAADWANGKLDGVRKWKSVGSNAAATQFKGTFDGQGHTISGLYGTYSVICQGMFATVGRGGVVKNFRLVNSYQASTVGYFGGIVGRSDGGKFEKIYCDSYVKATGAWTSNHDRIGGIAGTAIATTDGVDDVLFKECWYAGTFSSASMRNGGLVGSMESSGNSTETIIIQDCMFTGTVASTNGKHTTSYGTAGLVGCVTKNIPVKFKNCVVTDDVTCTGNQFKGALLGATSAYNNTNTTIENCYVVGNAVAPVAIATHSAFTGKVNGSATVVNNMADAAGITNVSSVWTTVSGTPVLKEFKELIPEQTNTVSVLSLFKGLFTGKEK